MGRDAAALGNRFPTFRSKVLSSSSSLGMSDVSKQSRILIVKGKNVLGPYFASKFRDLTT